MASVCTGGDDTRLEIRGSIAGVVPLTDIPGLNDISRVSIDMGRGEGVLLPNEDGSFEASDLKPDLYEGPILCSRGLTSDATESAYETSFETSTNDDWQPLHLSRLGFRSTI